jgi:hypothetical protein
VESFRSDWTRCHDTWQNGGMTTKPVAAHLAPVEIRATNVLGAVAHRAVCLVADCEWASRPVDAKRDGSVAKRVTDGARQHAAAHTDAQDVLDGRIPGGHFAL